MTEEKIRMFRQQISDLRKKLSELELRRSETDSNSQDAFWQQFVNITLDLDRFEQAVLRVNRSLIEEINQLRQEIIHRLEEYNSWRTKMRKMEKLFAANILRPGFVLQQAIGQKKYLEKQYQRIKTGIIEHCYDSLQDLEADIRAVLLHGEKAFESDQRSYNDTVIQGKSLWELAERLNPQEIEQTYNEDQIVQTFKRIVLPKVHPDTSETSEDIFMTVFDAYQTEDYLLMEAYIVQYRECVEMREAEDPLQVYDRLHPLAGDYHRLAGRLDRRLKALFKELTPAELEDPKNLIRHLTSQRDEIQKLIREESYKISGLREKIDGLTQIFIQIRRGNNSEK